jgi:hypothetical protein
VRNAVVKEGVQIYFEFKRIIFHSFSLQKYASFMKIFDKTKARFENAVLLQNFSAYLHDYMIGLSRILETCGAELSEILYLIVTLN